MLVQSQNLFPLSKMPWDFPALIMIEVHSSVLPNVTGALLAVNTDIWIFSFAEGSLRTFHSEKKLSELRGLQETSLYTLFIEVFMRTTLGQTGPSSFPPLKMCTYTLSTCTRETMKHYL